MANERINVSITGIDVGWLDLITFLIQLALCAVPALFLLTLVSLMAFAMLGGWAALMLGGVP